MLNKIQSFLLLLTRRSDIALATLLIAVIFLMILPMPTWLVDILIAMNIGGSIVLLMVAIYIRTPVAFSAFPAVLLITTLFRLSISITTTRLILLQADAGEIVFTFGDFVVQGNLIVGLVIFLIITLVQFIVITKGSERVAEVSARFSLDGMPGKQMSIDSDLRSGIITMAQARAQRKYLEKENQLYGAMDGAMKFVKGDAIAGILIILVNLIGGISVGTFQQGMTSGEALDVYSILTIGDGLVSQIPALFIAITAGIIVTRGNSEDSVNLGADIGSQILAQPNALLIGAVILLGFAMIPGFPTLIFITLGIITGALALVLMRIHSKQNETNLEEVTNESTAEGSANQSGNQVQASQSLASPPIIIEVAEHARQQLEPAQLNSELGNVRRALFQDLGVPFPGIHLRFNEALNEDRYVIFLNDIPVAQGYLGNDRVLAASDPEQLELLEIPYQTGEALLPELTPLLIDRKYEPQLVENNIPMLSPEKVMSLHLAYVLRKNASEFVGVQETHQLLAQLEGSLGELVKEALRTVPLNKLTQILRLLVDEDISIRNLRTILETLVQWGATTDDPELLTEHVRSSLKKQISYKYSDGQNILPIYMMDPAAEFALQNYIRQTPGGSLLGLGPEDTRSLINEIRRFIGSASGTGAHAPLITTFELRPLLRKLIKMDFHDLPVLSYQELSPDITVQPLAKIDFQPAGA
jgi:type III secretion protein V